MPKPLLLERLFTTYREQSWLAFEGNEQFLTPIFGHGDVETHGVQVTARRQIIKNTNNTGMVFVAQNDNWEAEYRRRPGLPLLLYRNRWALDKMLDMLKEPVKKNR